MMISGMRTHASICPAGTDRDEVRWLPRGELKENAQRAAGFRLRALRLSAAVCVGVALNVSTTGLAFAPAVAHTGGTPGHSLGLPWILPVERAPIDVAEAVRQSMIDGGEDDGDPDLPDVEAVDRAPIAVTADPASVAAALRAAGATVAPAEEVDLSAFRSGEPGRDPNEIVQFGAMRIPRGVVTTIVRAAAVTDTDPVYMMALADKESSFSTEVRARTSSAEGLFQFVAKTWLSVVRTYGPKHGLVDEAAAVELVDGQPAIKDEATRERVLGLRRDPYLSAVMAAEMMKRDRVAIERRIGRDLNRSEFYLAHFLGAQGAGKLMALVGEKPKQSAPRVFREAAKANRTLFFARQGKRLKDLTVAQVYDKLDQMIDNRISRYTEVTRVVATSAIDLRSPM